MELSRATTDAIAVAKVAASELLKEARERLRLLSEEAQRADTQGAMESIGHPHTVALFDEVCAKTLDSSSPLICALGYYSLRRVADRPAWVSAWMRNASGGVVRSVFDLNPTHDFYYEYTDAEWFRSVNPERPEAITGPFIDSGASNEYRFAVARAVVDREGSVIGVVAADMTASAVDSRLRHDLRKVSAESALVNRDHRVIASTSARWPVGSLLPSTTPTFHLDVAGAGWGLVLA
jgi:hypothetical protein